MRLPVVYLSKAILPPFNGLLIIRMKQEGLSEGRIASLLGLTQPAVNLYAKKKKEEYIRRLKEIGLSKDQIEDVVEKVVRALKANELEEATKIYLELLGSGLLCQHHRALTGLPESCEVCMKLFGSGRREEREELVLRVKEALRLLEKSRKFAGLLPEVRSNLVARLDKAVTEDDVIGIPGRLTEVKGKVRALHPPEFGASRHVARVLLEVSKRFPKVKAALNLRYDEEIDRCIRRLGWKRIKGRIDERDLKEEDPVLASLRRTLQGAKGPLDAFCHDAFYGLEASLYLFAEDPVELAEKAIALANLYVKTSSSSSLGLHAVA